MGSVIKVHCVIQCILKIRKYIILISKICFRNKNNVYILARNESFDFLWVFSQPVPLVFRNTILSILSFDDIILVTRIVRMFNIKSIFSMNSFIEYHSSCIAFVTLSWTWKYYLFLCSLIILIHNLFSTFTSYGCNIGSSWKIFLNGSNLYA